MEKWNSLNWVGAADAENIRKICNVCKKINTFVYERELINEIPPKTRRAVSTVCKLEFLNVEGVNKSWELELLYYNIVIAKYALKKRPDKYFDVYELEYTIL